MVVRVKLRIKMGDKVGEIVAIANSGYEASTPQLMLPRNAAEKLSLWPPPRDAIELTYETAGGPLRIWFLPRAARVCVMAEDITSPEVECDLAISPLTGEPLISDMLIESLGIVIEAAGRGLWRFRWDPPDKLRVSARPEI